MSIRIHSNMRSDVLQARLVPADVTPLCRDILLVYFSLYALEKTIKLSQLYHSEMTNCQNMSKSDA